MKFFLRTQLPVDCERAWRAATNPALLASLAEPLLRLEMIAQTPLPSRIATGDELHLRVKLACMAPAGTHVIRCIERDDERYVLRTAEVGTLVKEWRHNIRIRPLGTDLCEHMDSLEIRAGAMTVPTWVFAQLLYRYRQHRLKALLALS